MVFLIRTELFLFNSPCQITPFHIFGCKDPILIKPSILTVNKPRVLIVPQGGTDLPSLNDSASVGNFGLIVILSEVSYDYGGTEGYQSALTTDQWSILFDYQSSFGVRMVRLDVFPDEATGTVSLGGCCDDTQEQLVLITDDSAFITAGVRVYDDCQLFPRSALLTQK